MRNKNEQTQFQNAVYEATEQIPKGRVATYAALAAAVGKPLASRAVGNALHANPFVVVPCHRVVRSDGSVGGFAKGNTAKASMLRKEGVKMRGGKIDLSRYGIRIKKLS